VRDIIGYRSEYDSPGRGSMLDLRHKSAVL